MRTIGFLFGLLAVTVLAGAGCKKSEKAPPPPQINGVTVDIPKLDATFANASPEVKSSSTMVGYNLRYGKYEEALQALDKLANDPNVTEEQKKVVNEVVEQVKQLANAAPPAAPPAQ